MIRFPTMALVCVTSGCMFIVVGCGKQEAPKATLLQTPAATAARVATAQEVALVPDGTLLVSPDSGKPVRKISNTPALVYEGRLYFFCCPTSLWHGQTNPGLLKNAKPPNGYDLQKLAVPAP